MLMSTETNTTPPVETEHLDEASKGVLSTLFRELGEDAELVKKIAAEAKVVGWKAALLANSAAIIAELKDDIDPFKAAVPIAKAGYKTSEFWMIAGLGVANIVAVAIGKPIPVDVNVVLGVLTGIYTIVRGLIKK